MNRLEQRLLRLEKRVGPTPNQLSAEARGKRIDELLTQYGTSRTEQEAMHGNRWLKIMIKQLRQDIEGRHRMNAIESCIYTEE